MKKTVKNIPGKTNGGFSLMELLVVIAIITMLLAILVPGMQKLRTVSRKLSQKSLFHAIEIGVELFAKDFEGYPNSERTPVDTKYYCGAQHLAEALLGRDEKGYEPIQDMKWTKPGAEPSADYNLYWSSDKSLDRRKKPYVDLKDTGAYDPSQIFAAAGSVYTDPGGTTAAGAELSRRGPVLTDVYLKKKIELPNGETVKIGSPILYFKANTSPKALRNYRNNGPGTGDDTRQWTYNYEDNMDLFAVASLKDSLMHHYDDAYSDAGTGDTGITEFYQAITDPKIPFKFGKPYNATSFILMSAGEDSVFGTRDDVTNFNY